MTIKHRTKCFVFKKADRGESDRVYSVFTEDHGRLEIFGKAIRKINSKLKSGIDVFFLSEIEFIQGKSNRTLTGAIKIKRFDSAGADIEKIKFLNRICDILDSFINGPEKDCEIFKLLNETLENSLKIENCKLKIAFYYFLWNFLHLQGYGCQFYDCASCRGKLEEDSLYFSCKEGGVVCKRCLAEDKNAYKINSDIVKILRIILKKDRETMARLKVSGPSQKLLEEVSQRAASAFCPS